MGSTVIAVRVIPNAAQTRCEERSDEGVYKIRLQARPEKGKANKALVQFLAKQLGLSKSNVTLISGETARQKLVEIQNLTEHEVAERLLSH